MVRIRFRRVGARNQASYRIVAADKESPRDGRFLEVLGSYNPRTEPSTVQVDESRLFHWMKHGAQPSDAVVQTLRGIGTWERWERFKGGESLDKLVEEAKAAIPSVDPRTRRDDLIGKPSKKKKRGKQAVAEPADPAAEVKAKSEESAEESKTEEAAADEQPAEEAEAEEQSSEDAEEAAAPKESLEEEAAADEQPAEEAEAEEQSSEDTEEAAAPDESLEEEAAEE